MYTPQEQKQRKDQHQPTSQRMKPPENHMAGQNHHHHHQPPPPQKCPRCDSSNTKFCYYNNYSLSQPRYFCRACRRYWTQGGTLRNVPVGGGCRKSKRPKPSIPSSSGSEIGRTQSLSPAFPSQSLTGINMGQGLRPLASVMSMGNSIYTGGSFLSSLAAMQPMPGGINQGAAAVNLGGGNGQYDANMELLRGVSLPPFKPQPPQQFLVQNEYFPSQQSLSIPSKPLTSWTQSFTNKDPATTSSAASSSFWSGAATDGDNQTYSSFNPNHCPENHPGFDPPQ